MNMHDDRSPVVDIVLGRSIPATIGGAAAIVLAILGLANVYPFFMLSIATIAVGISLLFKGASIAAEYPRLLAQLSPGNFQQSEISAGMSAELLTAGAGIVLGILSLLGLQTLPLTSIAIIVFGVGLIMGSAIVSRLNALKINNSGVDERVQRIAEEMVSAAMSTKVLVGLAAVVLGILSLINLTPVILSLAALLAIGAASVLSGSTVTSKMIGFAHHHN